MCDCSILGALGIGIGIGTGGRLLKRWYAGGGVISCGGNGGSGWVLFSFIVVNVSILNCSVLCIDRICRWNQCKQMVLVSLLLQ